MITFSDKLHPTLGNPAWLRENEPKIKALLPDTWTHMENLSGISIGFGLKVLGVEWSSDEEFAKIMIFLERIGIMQRTNGYSVRANPDSIFN